MKLATSNSASSCGLPMLITKSYPEEKVGLVLVWELPKMWASPLVFLQQVKLATSNLACSWGLPRLVIESHPEEKVNVVLVWESSAKLGVPNVGLKIVWADPQNLGFPFNISATTKTSDFKIGRLVGFAKAHHKIPPRRTRGRGSGLGESQKRYEIQLRWQSLIGKLGSHISAVDCNKSRWPWMTLNVNLLLCRQWYAYSDETAEAIITRFLL